MNSQSTTKNQSVAQVNREFEEREAKNNAVKWGLTYIDLEHFPLNPEVLQLLPKSSAEPAGLIPFFRSGFNLRVALTDPQNKAAQKHIEQWKKDRLEVEVSLASKTGFKNVLKYYDSKLINKKTVELKHDFGEEKTRTFEDQSAGFKALAEKLRTLRSQEALNEIQITAVQAHASDVHIQPYENKGLLRFRVDGILHDICSLEIDRAKKIVARIKYDAGMKSNIFHIPQDGHLSFAANNREIDMRISSLPTEFFESIVMRILDSRRGIKSFSDLGFSPYIEEQIHQTLRHKNGMVLVTGPTGSGKTTTLYSMLSELNDTEKKLVTLEDPIEYHLDNVTQSQVSENSDYNFSNGLKALLRHDPDIVLIGEIRDLSTAKLAAEAALTGHVVLSSLHTNSALGAIGRLRNLGLESFNAAGAINAVFAQRLVRNVCPHCTKKESFLLKSHPKIKKALIRVMKLFPDLEKETPTLKNLESFEISVPAGCEKCSHTGYNGQTVLCEMVLFTPELKEKITENQSEMQLENYVRENQKTFLTLFEDGLRKVLLGQTTLEEVYRVVG